MDGNLALDFLVLIIRDGLSRIYSLRTRDGIAREKDMLKQSRLSCGAVARNSHVPHEIGAKTHTGSLMPPTGYFVQLSGVLMIGSHF
jgi:hypothetical protein